MSNHVLGDIADYLEGRLDSDHERLVKDHLDWCAECAADFAVALQLHEHGVTRGLRHLAAERIATLASEPEARITDFEQQHLDSCEDCRNEYEWAKTHPAEDEWDSLTSAAEGRAAPRKLWRWGWKPVGAGLAAAAATILLIIVLPDGLDVRDLARIEPLPVRISRATVTPGTFEAFRLRGLESYRSEDYAAALEHLGRAHDAKPEDDEVPLYMGSAHLMLGQLQDAADSFKAVSNQTSNEAVREESLWQLANTQIAAGLVSEARSVLEEMAASKGPHAAEARKLLEELAGYLDAGD